MHIPLKPHTAMEMTVAKLLFDTFQQSVNEHPDTVNGPQRYCDEFDNLERRLKQAWLDTARSVITVVI